MPDLYDSFNTMVIAGSVSRAIDVCTDLDLPVGCAWGVLAILRGARARGGMNIYIDWNSIPLIYLEELNLVLQPGFHNYL